MTSPQRPRLNYENAQPLEGAEVFASGHPVPDAAGAKAADAVIAALLGTDGPVLALISGGGSALLPAPVDGVSLDEKARVNEVLQAGLRLRRLARRGMPWLC